MIRPTHTPLLIALAVAGVLAPSSAIAQGAGVAGVWSNPKGRVHVRMAPCGNLICGRVVWATEQAQADAKRDGTDPLIGAMLLRNYRATSAVQWAGQLYLPERKASYYSTVQLLDAQTLKVSGCILGGLICKSQVWHRVSDDGAMVAR